MDYWFSHSPGKGGASALVTAAPGNTHLVRKAYGTVAGRLGIKDARGYLYGLRKISAVFAQQGYFGTKASPDGKTIFVNQRPTKVEGLSPGQMFSIFASIQLALKKTYDDVLVRDISILQATLSQDLEFCCNDPAVTFEVLWFLMKGYFAIPGKPGAIPPDDYEELVSRFIEVLSVHPRLFPPITTTKETA